MKLKQTKKQKTSTGESEPQTVNEWWAMLQHHEKQFMYVLNCVIESAAEQGQTLGIREKRGEVSVGWVKASKGELVMDKLVSFRDGSSGKGAAMGGTVKDCTEADLAFAGKLSKPAPAESSAVRWN